MAQLSGRLWRRPEEAAGHTLARRCAQTWMDPIWMQTAPLPPLLDGAGEGAGLVAAVFGDGEGIGCCDAEIGTGIRAGGACCCPRPPRPACWPRLPPVPIVLPGTRAGCGCPGEGPGRALGPAPAPPGRPRPGPARWLATQS